MNCMNVIKLFPAFIKNDLDEKHNFQIRTHLLQCESCLKKKAYIESLVLKLSSLNEDVPLCLKNRLIAIVDDSHNIRFNFFSFSTLKYASAFLGTILLIFNMFYFTNLFPSANKNVHSLVFNVNRLVLITEGLFEKLKASKNLLLFDSFQNKTNISKSKNYIIKNNTISVKEIYYVY